MIKNISTHAFPAGLLGIALALGLVGCGKSGTESPSAEATAAADVAAQTAKDAELKARELELAQREAEITAKEQAEVAKQQAEEAARLEREATAAKLAAKKSATAARNAAAAAVVPIAKPAPAKPATASVPPPAKSLQVPSGTQLTVALRKPISTKVSKVGDPIDSQLVADIMVDGQVAVPAGARVTGTITDVVSGSNAIGAIPALGLRFEHLVLPGGREVAINGDLMEKGASEKGRDTAKIVGGAAAGAILGHQVKKGSSGKVLGGLLGGAIGAVAAKKTGTEVMMAEDTQLTITLAEGFKVTP